MRVGIDVCVCVCLFVYVYMSGWFLDSTSLSISKAPLVWGPISRHHTPCHWLMSSTVCALVVSAYMLGSQVCTSSLAWRGLVGALGSVRPLPGSPWTLAYGPEARSGLAQLAAGRDYGLLHHDCWVTPHLELSSAASSMVA